MRLRSTRSSRSRARCRHRCAEAGSRCTRSSRATSRRRGSHRTRCSKTGVCGTWSCNPSASPKRSCDASGGGARGRRAVVPVPPGDAALRCGACVGLAARLARRREEPCLPGEDGRAGSRELVSETTERPRVAVVTGASSGIGEATARLLAGGGWRCVLVARRGDVLESIAAEIGGDVEACDIADRAAVADIDVADPRAPPHRRPARQRRRDPRPRHVRGRAARPRRAGPGRQLPRRRLGHQGPARRPRACGTRTGSRAHRQRRLDRRGDRLHPGRAVLRVEARAGRVLALAPRRAARHRHRGAHDPAGLCDDAGLPASKVFATPARAAVRRRARSGSPRDVRAAVEQGKAEVVVPWFPYGLAPIAQAVLPTLTARVLRCPLPDTASRRRPPSAAKRTTRGGRRACARRTSRSRPRRPGPAPSATRRRSSPVKPDEVEIALQVPLLTCDLVRQDLELVRIEEEADVLVGQEPRVRRVARLSNRSVSAETTGSTAPSWSMTRIRPPGRVTLASSADDELRPPSVMEHTCAPGDVERAVLERQRGGVADPELTVRRRDRVRPRPTRSSERSTPTTLSTNGASANASAPAPQPLSSARSDPSKGASSCCIRARSPSARSCCAPGGMRQPHSSTNTRSDLVARETIPQAIS